MARPEQHSKRATHSQAITTPHRRRLHSPAAINNIAWLQWRRQGVGVGGGAKIGGLRDEVPQKLKRFCKLMY